MRTSIRIPNTIFVRASAHQLTICVSAADLVASEVLLGVAHGLWITISELYSRRIVEVLVRQFMASAQFPVIFATKPHRSEGSQVAG